MILLGKREGLIMQEVLNKILQKLDNIENNVKNIENDVQLLKAGQKRIERKIGFIPEQYQNLEDYLGKQHLTIETLSARSIEHEAEIKDLKRLVKNQ